MKLKCKIFLTVPLT